MLKMEDVLRTFFLNIFDQVRQSFWILCEVGVVDINIYILLLSSLGFPRESSKNIGDMQQALGSGYD